MNPVFSVTRKFAGDDWQLFSNMILQSNNLDLVQYIFDLDFSYNNVLIQFITVGDKTKKKKKEGLRQSTAKDTPF